MSLTGQAGTYVEAVAAGLPPSLLGTITVSLEDGEGGVIMAPRVTGITESPVASGIYSTRILCPTTAGTDLIVWDPHTGDPTDVAVEQLVVTTSAPVFMPGSGDIPWAPEPDDVAALVPSYTRGGFDDDAYQAGAEQGHFTDTTSPTLAHVEELIDIACVEIEGRVGLVEIPETCWKLARACAIWHVVAAISAGKLPAQTDDAAGEHRSHVAAYLSALEELVSQARQPTALRIV